MSGFSGFFHNAVRSFTSFFGFVFDLMGNGLRFLCLTVRSHSALSAEVLLLRKQLAFYEERETQPRRLTNSARLSLVLWSHLFDWKRCLGDRQAGDSYRLAPQGIQAANSSTASQETSKGAPWVG